MDKTWVNDVNYANIYEVGYEYDDMSRKSKLTYPDGSYIGEVFEAGDLAVLGFGDHGGPASGVADIGGELVESDDVGEV